MATVTVTVTRIWIAMRFVVAPGDHVSFGKSGNVYVFSPFDSTCGALSALDSIIVPVDVTR